MYPLQYFLDECKPHSDTVTFTWKDKKIEWEPKYLAAVSSVYRTIPQCETFEINQRGTIKTRNAALLFHLLLPNLQGWQKTELDSPKDTFRTQFAISDDTWNNMFRKFTLENVYAVTEMYNFLGITDEACNLKELLLDGHRSPLTKVVGNHLYLGVAYHQIFLKTEYKSGVRQCEEMFVRWYEDAYSASPGDVRLSRADKNALLECKIKVYVEFERRRPEPAAEVQAFFKDVLGWTDPVEQFGVTISLSGQS